MVRGRGQQLIAFILALAVGAIFWLPSLAAGRGWFPAPLDDVYIHFDYARSLGQGHPFEWIAGQGYSSGETSPLYAVLLAIGWVVGFRGPLLGVWAAFVAVVCVASLLGSIRRLVAPAPCAWLIALVPLSIGILDWSLFSGMEVAAFAAALGRALEALAETRRRRSETLERRHWHLGCWGAALVLLRPEAAVIVAVFGVVAARGAGRRSGFLALARASLPGALATGAILGLNLLATGDARSAGAALKLLSSNPYTSDVDRARIFVESLITFWVKVVRGELAATPKLLWVLPLCAFAALFTRRRGLAGACIVSAIAWIATVTWNGNAPFHNFRYYAPALLLMSIAATFALAAVKRRWLTTGVTIGVIALGAARIPGQVRFFRACSANIRDQHVEVGARIAALGPGVRVLVGDAGAIPYVSSCSAVDALGLGGYHGMPFVRAAVHGEPAVIELIERLPPSERPTHLALYPNWFANLSSRFGVEIDRVTIANNVITGGPTKAIYRADWSTLDVPGHADFDAIDELDVADVVSEAEHDYVAPLPHGGWTTLDVLVDEAGARRFDGGRIIPDGARESFRVARTARGALVLRMRLDAQAHEVLVTHRGETIPLALDPPAAGQWRLGIVVLNDVQVGDVVTFEARGGYRDYHVWLERPTAASLPPPVRDKLAR